MAVLKSCCCFSLETGSRIIAVLYLIVSLFLIIFGGVAIGYAKVFQNLTEDDDERGKQMNKDDLLLLIAELLYSGSFLLVFGLLWLVFNSLLLAGIKRRDPKLIYSWLVMNAIGLVLGTIGLWVNIFSYSSVDGASKIGIIIGNLIAFAISCYLWMVVFSFYRKIEEERYTTTSSNATNRNAKSTV